VWDLDRIGDKPIVTLRGEGLNRHTVGVLCSALHPDGRTLATGGFDNSVLLWDLDGQLGPRRLMGHIGPVSDLVFSPRGSTLASCSWDGTVRLWNVAKAREISQLKRQPVDVLLAGKASSRRVGAPAAVSRPVVPLYSLVFLRDGRTLAAGDRRGIIHLWHADMSAAGTPTIP
jgi:WD40 repeat protein